MPTWPNDWEHRRAGEDCPKCGQGRPDEDKYGIRFFSGDVSDAYLQRSAPQPGYTVVVWRGRHVADPTELTAVEVAKYSSELLDVARALKDVFDPAHLNYMTWGNAVPHLHTHIVLRYLDDPRPERPLEPFEPLEMPVQELRDQVGRLRAALEASEPL
jgi:diadenosine tetraphosphate (Ap4A) HIT family hydrolase